MFCLIVKYKEKEPKERMNLMFLHFGQS